MNTKVEGDKGLVAAVETITRKLEVTLSEDKKVEVRLCKVKDIAVFLTFTSKLFDELGVEGGINSQAALEAAVHAKLQNPSAILKLISEQGPEVWTIVSKFTSMSIEDINELDLDDAITVIQKVVEINYDFFTKRVLPAIRAALTARLVGKKGTQAK